jgi:hypothetical protein
VIVVLAVAALIGVAGVLLVPGDDAAYGAVGKAVNGLDQRSFDAFLGCALGEQHLEKIGDNLALVAQIERASLAGRSYGQRLRESCMPLLDEMAAGLERLIPPDPLREDVAALDQAVDRFRSGWSGYIAYLEGLEGGFDPEADPAKRNLAQIAEAWRDYKVALVAFNRAVREKLDA